MERGVKAESASSARGYANGFFVDFDNVSAMHRVLYRRKRRPMIEVNKEWRRRGREVERVSGRSRALN
jgi:hypothetical protein